MAILGCRTGALRRFADRSLIILAELTLADQPLSAGRISTAQNPLLLEDVPAARSVPRTLPTCTCSASARTTASSMISIDL